MKVGDLVTYSRHPWKFYWIGVVVKEIPGTPEHRTVVSVSWIKPTKMVNTNPDNELEVISESR